MNAVGKDMGGRISKMKVKTRNSKLDLLSVSSCMLVKRNKSGERREAADSYSGQQRTGVRVLLQWVDSYGFGIVVTRI